MRYPQNGVWGGCISDEGLRFSGIDMSQSQLMILKTPADLPPNPGTIASKFSRSLTRIALLHVPELFESLPGWAAWYLFKL